MLKHLLDAKYIKRNTPNYEKMKVSLKKLPLKGTSLIANKNLKKGETIAYYRMTVYDNRSYKSPTGETYTFTMYNKNGNPLKNLIGDISLSSLPPPCRDIPYWAYFSNEPSGSQTANSHIDINTKENFQGRAILKAGDLVVYKLIADRLIKKGEEIVWCYGDDYVRQYTPNC